MAFRSARPHIVYVLLFSFVLAVFPSQVKAGNGVKILPLDEFVSTVQTGEVGVLRGIYVPEVLAGRIVPQPEDDPSFVSTNENTLTQFRLASQAGSTGLLAHNYLAGRDFFKVGEGQIFYLVYGDGHTETFIVTQILRFRALDPENIWSSFIDLEQGGLFSASDLFSKIYDRPGRVILQTCIQVGGEASWGRLFIIAEPYLVKAVEPEIKHTPFK
jgi:hypothetical protein